MRVFMDKRYKTVKEVKNENRATKFTYRYKNIEGE